MQPAGCAVPPDLDLAFSWAGHPFYLLDTRSARRRPAPGDMARGDALISAEQKSRFERWLQQHRNELKFVATPALLLPRHRSVARSPAEAAACDGWDGFPASRDWLLSLLVDKDQGRTVFLSGDEHQSLAARVTVARAGRLHTFWSIHSSGLYAPFPFAHGVPADLATPGPGCIDAFRAGNLHVSTRLYEQSTANGFARLTITPATAANPEARVQVDFIDADGRPISTLDLTW
jgi:hypothetical protein